MYTNSRLSLTKWRIRLTAFSFNFAHMSKNGLTLIFTKFLIDLHVINIFGLFVTLCYFIFGLLQISSQKCGTFHVAASAHAW